MLSFRTLTTTYSDVRLKFIFAVEHYVAAPYNDGAGIATIGIGFNLRDSAIAKRRYFESEMFSLYIYL